MLEATDVLKITGVRICVYSHHSKSNIEKNLNSLCYLIAQWEVL